VSRYFGDMPKTPKRPRDQMQLAKFIGEIATSETPGDKDGPSTADPAAVKRGKARAAKLSPSKRKAIAKKAARARWKK
jgi:hypothetical protein